MDEPRDTFRRFKTTRRGRSEWVAGAVAEVVQRIEQAEAPTRKRSRKGSDAERLRLIVEAAMCDLLHRHLTTRSGWLTTSRSKQHLGQAGDPVQSKTLPRVLDTMSDLGFVEMRKGSGHVARECRTPTTMRATEALFDLAWAHTPDGEEPQLVDFKHVCRPVHDASVRVGDPSRVPPIELKALGEEMDAVNRLFAAADIGIDKEALARTGQPIPDLEERSACRIFGNDLSTGGRLYFPFWVDMPKVARLEGLRLDGEQVVELDFGQTGLRILYGLAGVEPPTGDLYALPGVDPVFRDRIKSFAGAMVSHKRRLSRWPESVRPIPGITATGLYDLLVMKHLRIAIRFGCGAGGAVQRIESDIIIQAVLECGRAGFAALPVHDCLIVPESQAEAAETIMRRAFCQRSGAKGVPIDCLRRRP